MMAASPAADDEKIQMMAARIETLESEVESLRKRSDIVVILLDNAIKIGLLRLLRIDHIQYLSLKWGAAPSNRYYSQ